MLTFSRDGAVDEDHELMPGPRLGQGLDHLSGKPAKPPSIGKTSAVDADLHGLSPDFSARIIVLCPNGKGMLSMLDARRSSAATPPINRLIAGEGTSSRNPPPEG